MFEDVASQHRADDDTTETIEVVNGYSGCEETIVGSHTCHHHVANQKIGLSHSHIMFLRRLTLDEVQHGRRALHTEETAHQSAQCSCTYLHFFRRWQFNTSTKQYKVDADQNECDAKDASQNVIFDACQGKDGDGRDDDKCQQNRPKPLPGNVASQPPHDSCRSCDCQES